MHLNPLFLDLRSVQRILRIVSYHLQPFHLEVHHVLQVAVVLLVEGAVESQQIAVLQALDDLVAVVHCFAAESKQHVGLIVVHNSWLHLHKETQGVQVVLPRVFAIVLQPEKVAFPIPKLLAPILFEAVIGMRGSALAAVLLPGRLHPLFPVHLRDSDGHDEEDEGEHECGEQHLLGEDKACREKREAVDFVCEVHEELAVVSEFSFAEWAPVLARGGEVHEEDGENHHGEVRHDDEEADSQCD